MPRIRSRRTRLEALFHAHNGRCFYCDRLTRLPQSGETASGALSATIDHIVPRCHGGTHYWNNLVLACFHCNNRRGSQSAEAWLRLVYEKGPTP